MRSIGPFKSEHNGDTEIFGFLKSNAASIYKIHICKYRISAMPYTITDTDMIFILKCLCFIGDSYVDEAHHHDNVVLL